MTDHEMALTWAREHRDDFALVCQDARDAMTPADEGCTAMSLPDALDHATEHPVLDGLEDETGCVLEAIADLVEAVLIATGVAK